MTLKTARKKRGWTQVQLAEKSHVNQSQISRLERGENPNPHHLTVAALEQALRIRRGSLAFGHEELPA